MTDVQEQLTDIVSGMDRLSAVGTTATRELLVAARDRIATQDAKIAKLEEKLDELRPMVDDMIGLASIQNYDGSVRGVVQAVADRMKGVISR